MPLIQLNAAHLWAGRRGLVVHDLDLQLLDLRQPLPLVEQEMVGLLMQMTNLKFCLQVNAVVVERSYPILGLLPSLAHHDDGACIVAMHDKMRLSRMNG